MLRPVADGVRIHQSEFLQTNTTVVDGREGVLLIDAGLLAAELTCLADDLARPVVAGFSTHPDWDHLLWHPRLGTPPRYGTARCAEEARKQDRAEIHDHLEPTGIADDVPLDLLGEITGLPAGAERVPWDGPEARIIEHRAHAPGHAALVVDGVLLAGDMLSDVLIPMLDLDAADPVEDYLAALRLLEGVRADAVVPGHGSIGTADDLKARIERDRAYVLALAAGDEPSDPRIGPAAPAGWEWVTDVHAGQAQRLAARP
ncbi:MBL fold metallo-hydrolase [Actinoplanes sp. TRM 88003]|uniref:MBL fold metallo-hydrolase n=1 Tax=Paractinoplanes aksuensis TaxID=2939490 RepID=A0ABT1DUY8_9ACTN|nr:MBL fold metallo-hydrolase [Actinoplanes aksuensis]MCO8274363.1 MBL fold metallo-hydrolase [Actinoplanes aksuensis]